MLQCLVFVLNFHLQMLFIDFLQGRRLGCLRPFLLWFLAKCSPPPRCLQLDGVVRCDSIPCASCLGGPAVGSVSLTRLWGAARSHWAAARSHWAPLCASSGPPCARPLGPSGAGSPAAVCLLPPGPTHTREARVSDPGVNLPLSLLDLLVPDPMCFLSWFMPSC